MFLKIFAVHVVFLLLLSDFVIHFSRNYRYLDMQLSMFWISWQRELMVNCFKRSHCWFF